MQELFLSTGLGTCMYVLVDTLFHCAEFYPCRKLVIIKYPLKEAKNVSLLASFLSTDNKGPTYFQMLAAVEFSATCKSVQEASLG